MGNIDECISNLIITIEAGFGGTLVILKLTSRTKFVKFQGCNDLVYITHGFSLYFPKRNRLISLI